MFTIERNPLTNIEGMQTTDLAAELVYLETAMARFGDVMPTDEYLRINEDTDRIRDELIRRGVM